MRGVGAEGKASSALQAMPQPNWMHRIGTVADRRSANPILLVGRNRVLGVLAAKALNAAVPLVEIHLFHVFDLHENPR